MAFSENQYVSAMGDGSFILYWNGKIYPFGNQQDAEQAYNEMERTGGASNGAVPRAGTTTPPSGGTGGTTPPSGGGGTVTPPSGGSGSVTPPSGGGSGGGFGVVGGTGQLDAQQWQLQQEYQRLQLAEQKRQHEIDAAQRQREFESRLQQEARQLGLSEQEIAERRRQFDVQQESENRRWQQDYDQRKIEFAQTYGLDVRRLDQQDSQFNQSQGQQDRQFNVTAGLDQQRINNQAGQFNQSQGQQNEQYWAGLLGSLSGPQNTDKFLIAQSQLPAGVQGGSLSDVFNATPSFGGMRAGGPSWEQVWANFQGPRPSLGAGAGGPAPYTPPGSGSGIPGDTMPVNPGGSLPPVRIDEQVPPLVRGAAAARPGSGIPGDTMPVGGGGAQDWTDGGFWPNTPPFVGGGATTPPTIIPEQGPTGGRGIVPGFGPEPAPGSGQPPAFALEQGPSGQRVPAARAWDTMRQAAQPMVGREAGMGARPNDGRVEDIFRVKDPQPQRQAPWLAMQGGQPQQQADWAAQRNANQGGREVFYSGQPQQNGKGPGTGYLGPPVRDDGAPRIGLGGGGPAPRDSGGTGRPPIGLGGGGPAPRDDSGGGSNWTNTPAWQQPINQPINYSRAEYNRMSPYMKKRQESQWSAQSIDPSTAWNTMRQSWNSGGGGSTRTRWR